MGSVPVTPTGHQCTQPSGAWLTRAQSVIGQQLAHSPGTRSPCCEPLLDMATPAASEWLDPDTLPGWRAGSTLETDWPHLVNMGDLP